jgi:hypothetical protein
MTGAMVRAAARADDGQDLATAQHELLLYQQHSDDLVSVAIQQINATHQQLLEERQKHDQTKKELQKLQQLLGSLQPNLITLIQRLKVRELQS